MDGYILTSDGEWFSWKPHPTIPNPEPEVTTSAKCPCCGSRQFVSHQSRRVCSYCRSEQDGQPASTENADAIAFRSGLETQQADMYYNRLSMIYGSSALRPELAVRITQLTEGKADE